MTSASELLKSMVPISDFNKGQASRTFDRLKTEKQMVVLKNNRPTAFLLSPEEYERLIQIEEEYEQMKAEYDRLLAYSRQAGILKEEPSGIDDGT